MTLYGKINICGRFIKILRYDALWRDKYLWIFLKFWNMKLYGKINICRRFLKL
jgi:hypothetical protein